MASAIAATYPVPSTSFEQELEPEFNPVRQVEEIRLERLYTKKNSKHARRQASEERHEADHRACVQKLFESVCQTYAEAATRQPVVAQRYCTTTRSNKRTEHFSNYIVDVERLTKKALGSSLTLWEMWCQVVEGIEIDPQSRWNIVQRCYPLYSKHLGYRYFAVSK